MRALLLFVVLLLPFAAAGQEEANRKDLGAFLQRYERASVAKDVDFIDSVLSKDYSYTNAYGTAESRAAVMDFIRSEKAKPTFTVISFKTENRVVRLYGDTAVSTADWTMLSSQPLAHAGDVPHEDRGRNTMILVKQDGHWTIVQEHDSERSHDKKIMEPQVAALGRAYTAMIQRNDEASIAKILADDYVVTDESGTVLTKAQDLATYKGRATTLRIENVEYKDQKVRMITGSVAVEHSTIRFIGTRSGKPFDITERITTTWAFRDGRWLIVADHFSHVKPN